MLRRFRCTRFLLALFLAPVVLSAQQASTALRQGFIENRGQIVDVEGQLRPDIHAVMTLPGGKLYLRNSGLSYVFRRIDSADLFSIERRADSSVAVSLYRMDVEFTGANPKPRVVKEEVSVDYANYYLGHCPDGVLGVRSYARIIYHDLYPNIDLVLRATDSGVKSEFIVRRGGNPSQIRLRYIGAERVERGVEGGLVARTPQGGVEESKPYSYVEIGDRRYPVASEFRVEKSEVSFDIGEYDHRGVLTIDPLTRTWATYVGGNNDETAFDVATSPEGSAYIYGSTISTNFPVTTGTFQTTFGGGTTPDFFVAKFGPNGARRWATYYGGNNIEYVTGDISVAPNGDVAFGGATFSTNFPVSGGAYQTTYAGGSPLIVVTLDSTGLRRWGTFLSGTTPVTGGGSNVITGVAHDTAGNVVVVGKMAWTNFPVTPGAFASTFGSVPGGDDGFITKFSGAGALLWSTYHTGAAYSYAVVVDRNNDIVVAGAINNGLSPGYTSTAGAYQTSPGGANNGFVAKFNAGGGRLWSTYFSSGGAFDVGVDRQNNVVITGAAATGMTTTPGAQQSTYGGGTSDGFVARFSSNGARLLMATYCGGTSFDELRGVAVNGDGTIAITGYTLSTNLATTASAFQTAFGGGTTDAYLARYDTAGVLLYGSYYGGAGVGNAGNDRGYGIALDSTGALYLAGYTESLSFPVTTGAFQTTKAAGFDAVLVKFDCQAAALSLDSTGLICSGDTTSQITLTAGPGYRGYRWSTGDTVRSISVRAAGTYTVLATDSSGCLAPARTIAVTVRTRPSAAITPAATALCPGDSAVLTAAPVGTGISHRWSKNGTQLATTPTLMVRDSGVYTLVVSDAAGCRDTTSFSVGRYRPIRPFITPDTLWLCPGDSSALIASDSGYTSWRWSNGRTGRQIVVRDTGRYTVSILDTNGCHDTSLAVVVRRRTPPSVRIVAQGTTNLCPGDSVALSALPGGAASYRWSNGAVTSTVVVRNTGTYRVVVTDANGCRDSAEIGVNVAAAPTPSLVAGSVTPPGGRVQLCDGDSVALHTEIAYHEVLWSDGTMGWLRMVRQAGTYTARVRDANGCLGFTDTIRVTVGRRPKLDLSGPIAVCAGSRKRYTVTTESGVNYTWSVGGSGSIASGQGSGNLDVQWGSAGSGWVRVEAVDPVSGCRAVDSIGVTVGTALSPLVRASRGLTLCPGDSVELDAGTGYTRYGWSTGETTQRIVVRSAGSYTVSVEDADGCRGTSDTVRVRLNTPPVPTIISSSGTTLCEGDSTVLSAGSYAGYRWSTGAATPTITVKSAGTYTVEVTDTAGCSGTSAAFTLVIRSVPQPVIDGPNAVCVGAEETYTVGDSIPLPVNWTVTAGGVITGGQGTRALTVRWGGAGVEQLTAEASINGCQRTGLYNVTIATELHPHLEQTGVLALCAGDSVELAAPSGYSRYQWNTGEGTQRIMVKSVGEYWVEVESGAGCSGVSDTVVVVEAVRPTPTITPSGATICADDSVELDAGAGYGAYRWSTGETSQRIIVKSAGGYGVEVQSAGGGCWGAAPSVTIQVAVPVVPTITQVADDLESTPAVSYQWSRGGSPIGGAGAQRYQPTLSGDYTVTIVDSNGCSATSAPYRYTNESAALARLEVGSYSADPGQEVSLTPVLTNTAGLSDGMHYTLRLRYARSLLAPRSATTVGVTQAEREIEVRGTIHASMTGGELRLDSIPMIATLGRVESTALHPTLFTVDEATALTVDTAAGSFTLTGLCRNGGTRLVEVEGETVLKVWRPNPANDHATIDYEMVESGRMRLVLLDMQGREVSVISEGMQVEGRFRVETDVRGLPNGGYTCVLITPTEVRRQQVRVQR